MLSNFGNRALPVDIIPFAHDDAQHAMLPPSARLSNRQLHKMHLFLIAWGSDVMRMSRRQGGFTLLELSAVITVVGTLSALALPRYADMMRSARVAKMEIARRAVNESAQMYHMKWMLAGSPATTTVLDKVQMNEAGYPTSAGILIAAGVADNYDTRVAGVIAVDPQHPKCSLVYAADTGTSTGNYADGSNC
jgi:MSHA pilin protein MshA